MSYEVFARKYRPKTFDDLVGQTHVAQTLKNAVEQNRLAHAYLFVGPRGTGKTSTARILAKALNCVKGLTPNPCGVCDNCKEIGVGNSLSVLEYDAASNTQVDKIRELIIERVKLAPTQGYKYKVYIIDEVHMLSNSSFNALLKTLEEPPPHVIFMFATTEVNKVPLTVVSRCQRFDLHRIATNLIANHLQFIAKKEKIKLAPAAAHAIARGAEGGLRDAESMLDQLVAFCGDSIGEEDVLKVFGFTSEQTVASFTEKILTGATADAVQLLHDQSENGKDLLRLMTDLIGYLRDLLVFQVKPDALSEDVDPESQKTLGAQAGLIQTDRLLELIDQFAEAEGRMKWAPNKKLHFEVALIKAIQSLSQVTLNDVLENLNALRDGKEVAPGKRPTTAAKAPAAPARSTVAPAKGAEPAPRVEEKPAAASAPRISDPAEAWAAVCAKITRAFLRTVAGSLTFLGTDGRNFLLGFPAAEKAKIETVLNPDNRRQLETLLKEVTGQDWSVKLSAQEGLSAKETTDQPAKKGTASCEDDPLIQQALEMFKGQIKS